jgi:hypothetical protein
MMRKTDTLAAPTGKRFGRTRKSVNSTRRTNSSRKRARRARAVSSSLWSLQSQTNTIVDSENSRAAARTHAKVGESGLQSVDDEQRNDVTERDQSDDHSREQGHDQELLVCVNGRSRQPAATSKLWRLG